MVSTRLTRRYAQALMETAEEQKQLDRVVQDLEMLQRTAKESKDFVIFLKSPVIKKERKKEIFAELLKGKVGSLTLEFLTLLCEKGREDIFPQLITQFFLLRDERLGIVHVEVKAATELSKEQFDNIQKRFENMTKKKVRISFNVDKYVKGGFVARVGDTVYDGSVQHQLELMRARFAEGAIHN
ncbi:MAG: F0F1 ATP synthase subunit delta [Ignavibacteriae bacterium]|nr:F0F1 ATP synthase subunit delta [Ignavibacteriota bacterium]